MRQLEYLHVDVFAPHPYSGNTLPVFLDAAGLDARQMQAITCELRHFESTFLTATEAPRTYRARVFDLLDELPFAGHPILGAAAALHHSGNPAERVNWTFELAERTVTVTTIRAAAGFRAFLDQGKAVFLSERDNRSEVAAAFGLGERDLDPALPLQVVSTGLEVGGDVAIVGRGILEALP